MTTATRTQDELVAQWCDFWSAVDADWTTDPDLHVEEVGQGAGNVCGSARLRYRFGAIKREGAAVVYEYPPLDIADYYIRILQEDATGSISYDGRTWSAIWWGLVKGVAQEPDAAASDRGGSVVYTCVGILALLDDITINRGWCVSNSVSTAVDPGHMPVFNHLGQGDRSSSTYFIQGSPCYIHSHYEGTAYRWSAYDIIELLLAGFQDPAAVSPPSFTSTTTMLWAMGGQTGALDFEPADFDCDGMTVLEAITSLVHQRRGLSLDVSVIGNTATINIRTVVDTAITVAGYTLPASTNTSVLVFDSQDWAVGLEITRDYASCYDIIEVIGQRPYVNCTVNILKNDGGVMHDDFPASENYFDRTNHQYTVDENWLGNQWGSTTVGLRTDLDFSATLSSYYGLGGYTGDRAYQATGMPSARLLRLEQQLHMPAGTYAGTWAADAPAKPVVVFKYAAGEYEDVSAQFPLRVVNDPPSIWLGAGDDDGDEIYSLLYDGNVEILVTMTWREVHPLKVSWQRQASLWPRDIPRTMQLRTAFRQVLTLAGTVRGVNSFGTALLQASSLVYHVNEIGDMRSLLALCRSFYSEPSHQIRWQERGIVDSGSLYAPGVLLTDIDLGDADTESVNALITSRRFVRRNGAWWTLYEAKTLLPDPEVFL